MNHIAIDLGASKSYVCIRDEKGKIESEEFVLTTRLKSFLKKQEPGRVVMETCSESWAIADVSLELGHQIRVVPGHLVRSLGVGSRGVKNDRKDAQVLSEVSTRIDLPCVYIRSQQSKEIQTMLKMRISLVACRTKLINSVRGWMRTQAIRMRGGTAATVSLRLREKIKDLPKCVSIQLDQIDSLTQSILLAEKDLKAMAKKLEPCQNLQTIPGVGLLTSLCFVSVIDDPKRFANAHHLQSYLGLTPGENSSGNRQRTTSITKAGSSILRYHLVQAAWVALMKKPEEPMVIWAKNIEKRRGKKIAVVALARKMAGIMFYLLKHNTVYQAQLAAATM